MIENIKSKRFTIGQMAKASGVGVETVRYYQKIGLIEVPELPYGSIRRYSQQVVSRIIFIKRAQSLGFSLEEINSLLKLDKDNEPINKSLVRSISQKRLIQIRQKITDLMEMEKTLNHLIHMCEKSGDVYCPIIESFSLSKNK
jgi:MerR family mercuric resistance operon transcriptional regulator